MVFLKALVAISVLVTARGVQIWPKHLRRHHLRRVQHAKTVQGHLFDEFVTSFKRPYEKGSEEYALRRELFETRLLEISHKNRRPHRRWTAGVNGLTDRTDAELARLRGWRGSRSQRHRASLLGHNSAPAKNASAPEKLPKEVSWMHLKASQLILDQGSCGSCWAVVTANIVRAHHEIKFGGDSPQLSVQELLNCVPNPRECGGQGGCSGATIELGLQWIKGNGLSLEESVPYFAGQSGSEEKCARPSLAQSDKANVLAGEALGMTGFYKLPENRMEPLMRALLTGPVGIAVAADGWSSYVSGVFDDCVPDAIMDHAVTLVAYGEEDDTKYWTIQNSWGDHFGEDGFIRVLRHEPKAANDAEEAFCGTDNQPEVGSGCKGGPASVRVCGMCGILYDSVQPIF